MVAFKSDAPVPAAATAQQHLGALRTLLRRDYLTGTDWDSALRELASMAKQALQADEALVALYDAQTQEWSALSSEGKWLDDAQIHLYGSRSVLQRIQRRGQPILTTSKTPLMLDSESIAAHSVRSVLAVPMFFWDARQQTPQQRFAGCLYAHRTAERTPFSQDDVELFLDLAELGQRNLNLLRHLHSIEAVLEVSQQQLQELRHQTAEHYRLGQYETRDPWFAESVLGTLARVSHVDRVGILLLGPTGSGKSHLAQAYHYACPRKEGPFTVLDCSQVTSSETLASELFGYAPNSGYANAPRDGRPGKAALADKGTLFIDEIATLPAELQQRLLRLLQTGFYSPLGSSAEKKADLQVIAASNEDLEALIAEGRFREDLYWRLGELILHLPPLDQRPADIPGLAQHFLRNACQRFGRDDLQALSQAAVEVLLQHPWSSAGNIRGLEHTLSRSVLLTPPGTQALLPQHLKLYASVGAPSRPAGTATAKPDPSSKPMAPLPPRKASFGARTEALRLLLEAKILEHHGVVSAMAADPRIAEALGYRNRVLPPSSLHLRLRKMGLRNSLLAARQQRKEELGPRALAEAIRKHGSSTAAARALGTTRDAVSWQLRKAGLSVQGILQDLLLPD